jgi:multidrug resistance protein, MATE family
VLAASLALPVLALLTVAPRALALLGYQAALAGNIAQFLAAARWGAPAFLGFVVLRSLLSATSRVRPVMLVLLCAFPVNAALNWALVFGHLGMPRLGIVGAGCAYAVMQWLMLLGLALYALLDPPSGVRVHFGGGLAAELRRIIRLGLPISGLVGLETGLFTAAGIMVGLLGADALGAHQVAMNAASVTFMLPLGIGQAATVRVALQLGAGRPAAARHAAFLAVVLGGGLMLLPCLLMLAAPRLIAGCYLDLADPANHAAVAIAVRLLGVAALFQVFDGVQVIAAGSLRGYRDTAVPMAVAAFGYWGVGFAGGWVMAFPLGYGAAGLWYGLALGLASVAVLLTLRLHYCSRGTRQREAVPEATALPG